MLGESLQSPPGSSVSSTPDGKVPGHRAVSLDQFLTTKQVAERLGLTEASVHGRVKEGRFHPIKRRVHTSGAGRKHILAFNPDEVENEIARMHEAIMARPALANRFGKGGPIPKKLKVQGSQASKVAVGSKPEAKPASTSTPVPATRPPPVEMKSSEESEGERCARAARLFLEGKQQLDVVVEMEITFERARYYWESYQLAQPGWFLTTKVLSRVRSLIGWSEEPPTAEGFERALVAHVARQLERAPESSGGKEAAPGMELSDEDRAQLAELERELAAKKPENKKPDKKSPPAQAAPVPVTGPKPPAPPAASALPLATSEPSHAFPSASLFALASMTGVDMSKLAAPAHAPAPAPAEVK